jgi:spore coat protein U-like protein
VKRLRVLIVTLVGIMHMLAGKGEALSCKARAESVVFSGIDILSGAPVDASASLDVTCTVSSLDGTAGSLLEIHVCPGIGEGSGGSAASTRRLVRGDGQDILNYNIYQDAARTEQWGHSSFPALGDMPMMTMIITVPPSGSSADVSASRPVYFRLFGSQQTSPPGTYMSNFGGADAQIRFGLGGCQSGESMTASPLDPFSVTASFTKGCMVATRGLNFGSTPDLSVNVDATGQVNLTCTQSTEYDIGLSVGGFAPTTRRMTMGDEFVTYGLYRDAARTLGWGEAMGTQMSGVGTGLTESHVVYGRVMPQTAPSPGTYSDTVVVTIAY